MVRCSRRRSAARSWLGIALAAGLCIRAGAAAPPVVVDGSVTLGSWDHFGASDAWSLQFIGQWSLSNRTLVADLLLSTNRGIGLSSWRFNLGAGVVPSIPDRWRSTESFLVSSNVYDWTRQAGQRWFLRAARERGVTQFLATVYSAPTNFTRNGLSYCTDGRGTSNLKPGYEGAFADYLADVLEHFHTNSDAAERVTFNWVAPFNEPYWEWNGNSQEGSRAANADILALAQALKPQLQARGLTTEILVAEAGDLAGLHQRRADISTKYGADYGNYLAAFAAATNLFARPLSGHSYWTDDPPATLLSARQTLRSRLEANPHWRYWQSEYCILGSRGPGRDLGMGMALDVARVVWADLHVAGATAWQWWLAVSRSDYKDGLLYTDFGTAGTAETLFCSKNFWAFGNYSRFIRPGWQRLRLTGATNTSGLMGVAFRSPATPGALAVVLVNAAPTHQPVRLVLANFPSSHRITGWRPWLTSDAPSDNLERLPAVAPGADTVVPARSVVTFTTTVTDRGTAPVIQGPTELTLQAGDTPPPFVFSIQDAETPGELVDVTASADAPEWFPSATNLAVGPRATGGISREVFTDVAGATVTHLARAPFFPATPSLRTNHPLFEAPAYAAANVGTRMRGFVVAPQSGDYHFWIASDDESHLYLSPDESPAGKALVAWVTNWTGFREWTRQPRQQSAPVALVAGRRYYVEAVHKQASGNSHLAVGWQLPDGTYERPIPGPRLNPWPEEAPSTFLRELVIRPVPGVSGTTRITLRATDRDGGSAVSSLTLRIVPPPALTAHALGGDAALLSWPDEATGYSLWSAEVLVPSTAWHPVPNPVVQEGGTFQVGVTSTWTAAYFRLVRPTN